LEGRYGGTIHPPRSLHRAIAGQIEQNKKVPFGLAERGGVVGLEPPLQAGRLPDLNVKPALVLIQKHPDIVWMRLYVPQLVTKPQDVAQPEPKQLGAE